jgi:phosphohistidine phosphatase
MPMLTLYILRHAEAEPEARTDAERALTSKGRDQAKAMGRFCGEHEIYPALILTSPLVRAQQTAKLVCKELGEKTKLETAEFLSPGMNPERAFAHLNKFSDPGPLMLVGHEPDLSELIAASIGGVSESIRLRKAGLAKLTLPEVKPGVGTLDFLLTPKLL